MILGIEIALLVMGFLALVRGRMTLGKNRVVLGIPARMLGMLALAPLPVAFVLGVGYVLANAPAGQEEQFADENGTTLMVIEAAVVLSTAAAIFALGTVMAVDPAEAERLDRRRRGDDDERYYGDDGADRAQRGDLPHWDRRGTSRRAAGPGLAGPAWNGRGTSAANQSS